MAYSKLKSRAHFDAANILYANSYTGIVVNIICASMLVYAFINANNTQFKQLWLLSIFVVLALRFIDALFWHRDAHQDEDYSQRSIVRFSIGTHITALLWCTYTLVVLPDADTIELACIIITMSGMVGGGTTILSAHKKTSMFYSIILLAPGSIVLLLGEEKHQQLFGFLGFTFCMAMVFTAKKAAQFTDKAISLKNENAILVSHMEEEVEQRTQKIYELSNLDPLSKLYNRTAFLKHLDRLLDITKKEQQTLAVLFIDLDKFKEINDSLGHETGDILLQKTAQRLKVQASSQQLLCRWGGDEFLMALPNVTQSQAKKYANDLIQNISVPYEIHGRQCVIGATIGIAIHPEHSNTANQLIQLADTAMYHQKNMQPSQVKVFSSELNQHLAREKMLKENLETAIDNKQISLNFQPIVSTRTNQVTSFEALLRWNLAGENISPVDLIPLAEQYGYISSIGAWVLQQACLTARQWPKDIAVAVNVSVLQLHDEQFIATLDQALIHNELAPERLHIEITESVFSSDKATLIQRIKAMQSRGIKVSIDDFGTEYSSLSVIQDLGVNIIKIDRSFVQKLDGNGFAIINAVVQIAAALGYKVVAEGVETQHQADMLKTMGVDYLQGFLFAKPMLASQLDKYLT